MALLKKTLILQLVLILVFIQLILPVTALESIDVKVQKIEINGVLLNYGGSSVLSLDRNQEIEVRTETLFNEPVKNVRVIARIDGYEFDRILDSSKIFDSLVGAKPVLYAHTFHLKLPADIQDEDYTLYIEVSAPGKETFVQEYNLRVARPRREVVINNLYLSPRNEITAGSAIYAHASIENFGKKDERDLYVYFAIPKLGLQDVDFIKSLPSEEEESTEEIFFRIPPCTKSGEYDVTARATFARNHGRTDLKVEKIKVTKGRLCPETSELSNSVSFSDIDSIVSSQKYLSVPIEIKNDAPQSKSYLISVEGADDFQNVRFTPSNVVVVGSSKSEVVSLQLVPKKENLGTKTFTVFVKSNFEIVAQKTYTTTIIQDNNDESLGLRQSNNYTVALLISVVIVAFVVLGLIMLLIKSEKRKEDEEEFRPPTNPKYY